MENQVLFNEEGVMITTDKIIKGKEMYPVASIVSVKTSRQDPAEGCSVILVSVVCWLVAVAVYSLMFYNERKDTPFTLGNFVFLFVTGTFIYFLISGIKMTFKDTTYKVHLHLKDEHELTLASLDIHRHQRSLNAINEVSNCSPR